MSSTGSYKGSCAAWRSAGTKAVSGRVRLPHVCHCRFVQLDAVTVVNPERNTQQLAEKLRAAGVPITLRIYPRPNHFTLIGAFAWPLRSLAPVIEDVVAFVRGGDTAR